MSGLAFAAGIAFSRKAETLVTNSTASCLSRMASCAIVESVSMSMRKPRPASSPLIRNSIWNSLLRFWSSAIHSALAF